MEIDRKTKAHLERDESTMHLMCAALNPKHLQSNECCGWKLYRALEECNRMHSTCRWHLTAIGQPANVRDTHTELERISKRIFCVCDGFFGWWIFDYTDDLIVRTRLVRIPVSANGFESSHFCIEIPYTLWRAKNSANFFHLTFPIVDQKSRISSRVVRDINFFCSMYF